MAALKKDYAQRWMPEPVSGSLTDSLPAIRATRGKLCQSSAFQSKVLRLPIVIITGMIHSLGLDDSKFSLNAIKERHSEFEIEIVHQPSNIKGSWAPKLQYRSIGNIGQYINYMNQVKSVMESEAHTLSPEKLKRKPMSKIAKEMKTGRVRFGANIDIEGWTEETSELWEKVPTFLQCSKDADVLQSMRQEVKGMNTAQLYIKVPGVWTGGHEENCRFHSININHGPGSSEWGAIEGKYAPRLRQLVIEEFGVDIYKVEGEWFPDSKWLKEKGIPAMYGVQHAGDTIVLQGGTLHWVRSLGFSVSSSWNFGPFESRQLNDALDRYNINRTLDPPMKSLVPMQTLCIDVAAQFLHSKSPSKLLGMDRNLWKTLAATLEETAKQEDASAGELKNMGIVSYLEPLGASVVYCENPNCNGEVSVHYAMCNSCDASNRRATVQRKRKAAKKTCSPGKKPVFLCVPCAKSHPPDHECSAYYRRKYSFAQLEKLLACAQFLADFCGTKNAVKKVLTKTSGSDELMPLGNDCLSEELSPLHTLSSLIEEFRTAISTQSSNETDGKSHCEGPRDDAELGPVKRTRKIIGRTRGDGNFKRAIVRKRSRQDSDEGNSKRHRQVV